METLKARVVAAIQAVFDRFFECPERNWPGHTHEAIHKVKQEAMAAVTGEFDRHEQTASTTTAKAQGD